jgi:type IV pilus assembly protein PilB
VNANATANLVGITGIARRLVLDGVLGETDARKALEESGKLKRPVHQYLLEKKLVTAAHVAGANAVEFGMPLFDAAALDLSQAATKLISEELINKHVALRTSCARPSKSP